MHTAACISHACMHVTSALHASALRGMCFARLQVERAKKCLDFAATLYLIHLAVVSIVGGFPTSISW